MMQIMMIVIQQKVSKLYFMGWKLTNMKDVFLNIIALKVTFHISHFYVYAYWFAIIFRAMK